MSKETIYFSISLKKIEGTENDYEQILKLNECFKILSEGKLKQVEDLVSKLVEDVKGVIGQEEPKCEP